MLKSLFTDRFEVRMPAILRQIHSTYLSLEWLYRNFEKSLDPGNSIVIVLLNS